MKAKITITVTEMVSVLREHLRARLLASEFAVDDVRAWSQSIAGSDDLTFEVSFMLKEKPWTPDAGS